MKCDVCNGKMTNEELACVKKDRKKRKIGQWKDFYLQEYGTLFYYALGNN